MPINIINTEEFAELRQNFGYYVDKTRFLVDFLQDPTNADRFRSPASATLFTRPRRFGKTLFMSMLAEFFDIRKQGDGQKLFEGLAVCANTKLCQEWMHQYPVISLTLKRIEKLTYKEALEAMQNVVGEACTLYYDVLDSPAVNPIDIALFRELAFRKAGETNLCDALLVMTRVLFQHYGKPVILLIDEYDVPVAKAVQGGYYDEMIIFMRNFLSSALKSNPWLKFAILTGALRITKESIFTGLNNLKCYDITSIDYADTFGFTQDEVDKMLAEAGYEEKRDIIREWFDGYHLGDRTDIYCPWSIMNYLYDLQKKDREPQAYWVSTSANDLPRDFVGRLPEEADVPGKIATLMAGTPIAVKLNPAMNYVDVFKKENNFWTLLYLTGYLTLAPHPELFQADTDEDDSLLAIPNREVCGVFKQELEAWLEDILPKKQRTELYSALWEQDVQKLETQLTIVLEGCSFHDAKESYYHGMLYGIFKMRYYGTRSNGESGRGRYDLIVPDMKNSRAAVLEFKLAPSAEKLEASVQSALGQIADRDYDARLRADGFSTLLRVGVAFFQKSVKVGFAKGRTEAGML